MTLPVTFRQPRPIGIILGIVMIVVGGVLLVAGLVSGFTQAEHVVRDLQRVPARGGQLHVSEPGSYYVFVEYPGADDVEWGGSVPVITTSEGRDVPVSSVGHSEAYSLGGHEGRLVGRVDLPTSGTYFVRQQEVDGGRLGSNAAIAFGRRSPFSSFGSVVLQIVLGVVLGVAGIVTLIVSLVRRSRRRRLHLAGAPPMAPPVEGWSPGSLRGTTPPGPPSSPVPPDPSGPSGAGHGAAGSALPPPPPPPPDPNRPPPLPDRSVPLPLSEHDDPSGPTS